MVTKTHVPMQVLPYQKVMVRYLLQLAYIPVSDCLHTFTECLLSFQEKHMRHHYLSQEVVRRRQELMTTLWNMHYQTSGIINYTMIRLLCQAVGINRNIYFTNYYFIIPSYPPVPYMEKWTLYYFELIVRYVTISSKIIECSLLTRWWASLVPVPPGTRLLMSRLWLIIVGIISWLILPIKPLDDQWLIKGVEE